MRKIKLVGSLCGIFMIMAFGCEKNQNDLPVEFSFRLLDTLGNESNTFSEGENIIFSFLLENKTSQELNVENFFPLEELFKVYKTNREFISLGVPYDGVCYIGYFIVPPNGILEFKVPWVVSGNLNHYGFCLSQGLEQKAYLPKGSYFSAFSAPFNIDGSKTDVKNFKVEFTVK